MNKKIISVALALAVAITAAAFVFKKQATLNQEETSPANPTSPSAPSSTASPAPTTGTTATSTSSAGTTNPAASQPTAAPANGTPAAKSEEAAKLAATPLSKEEVKSVKMMATAMVQYMDPKFGNPDLLKDAMTKAGFKPTVAKDFNPYTGKMIIVHCENPPPGTRCCHAQYFEDEHKKPFLQHMSFELRPSADGMNQAVAALNEAIRPQGKKPVGAPTKKSDTLAKWDLKDNFEATILKLENPDDLKGDPFCAHEIPDDLGTYKVMVEMVPDKDEHE